MPVVSAPLPSASCRRDPATAAARNRCAETAHGSSGPQAQEQLPPSAAWPQARRPCRPTLLLARALAQAPWRGSEPLGPQHERAPGTDSPASASESASLVATQYGTRATASGPHALSGRARTLLARRLGWEGVSSSSESNITLRRRSISSLLARGVIAGPAEKVDRMLSFAADGATLVSARAEAAAGRATSSSSSRPLKTRCRAACLLVELRGVARPPRLSSCKRGTPVLVMASGSVSEPHDCGGSFLSGYPRCRVSPPAAAPADFRLLRLFFECRGNVVRKS